MQDFDALATSLQPHYSRFNVAGRLLFTGHSHQAWPDMAFRGMQEYFEVASRHTDNKWEHAFEKTEVLRGYLRSWYDDPDGRYCREQNTHILTVSWLSALDLQNKPKIITTAGEFHSMYRQLRSLEQKGMDIHFLPCHDDETLLQSIRHRLDEQTAAVMISRVYFETSGINTRISEIAEACRITGVPLLIDDYHGTNVAPLSLKKENLEDVYLLIGGYKYLQWGEGNCFLRYPKNCSLNPVITGWFSSFKTLDKPRKNEPLSFDDGDQKFATATYDPVSQYRAAEVADFFRQQNLSPEVLRNQSQAQIGFLRALFDKKDFDPAVIRHNNHRPLKETGGFLALKSPHARTLQAMMLKKGIFTDARDDILRIGPAPYISSKQCRGVINALFDVIKSF